MDQSLQIKDVARIIGVDQKSIINWEANERPPQVRYIPKIDLFLGYWLAAVPAVLSIGLEDPGGGQSDVAAPVFLAYENYLDVSDAVDASLATLTIAVVQAFRIRGRLPPPKLKAFHEAVDAAVAPLELERIGGLGASLRGLKIGYSNAVIGQGELAALI